MTITPIVSILTADDVRVLLVDNPPVNAISHRLREELDAAFRQLQSDKSIRGIVIACLGKTFIAGAEIGEIGTARQSADPQLPKICQDIEAFSVPVVAAIHGSALGGGLEIALSCHHRIADSRANFGFPEVNLGFVPGSGGTVRLPRVVGPIEALKIIASGKPIGAQEALEIGLIDTIARGDLVQAATAFVKQATSSSPYVLSPTRSRDEKLRAVREDPTDFDQYAQNMNKVAKGGTATLACAEAVRNAVFMTFDEAIGRERELFLELSQGSESKALRHLFFAERLAGKIEEVQGADMTRAVSKVGVLGAGTMGCGIAMSFANAGYGVVLVEENLSALKRGLTNITISYDRSVASGSINAEQRAMRLLLISGETDIGAIEHCDLIIEAVYEDMTIKSALMGVVGKLVKPSAILATNTSYLDVNEIALASGRPTDVVGMHFFSPANVMKLLEIVRARRTASDVLATVLAIGRKLGKVPIVVGVCHGFLCNRMLAARGSENEHLLLEGATPQQIDNEFLKFGWPMGPFQMGDLAGLDIGWRNRKASGKVAEIADQLCESGHFGQKTGTGWYRYENGSKNPNPNSDVLDLIERSARKLCIARRSISGQEIIERTLYPMINEGAKILAEGITPRASDIDVAWVNGYGFPRHKGGPMFWAREAISLAHLNERLLHWHKITGRSVFEPSDNLEAIFAQ